MQKKSTSDRLKKLMEDRDLKQVDILKMLSPYCEKYGVKMNKSDISQYVSGKVEPSQEKLVVLSMALNVSEAWLMGLDVPMMKDNSESDTRFDNIFPIDIHKYPLLGSVACGKPIFMSEERESYIMTGTDIGADFCLKAKGDSMINARIMDGDIVFIHRQPTVENGEIAAVAIDDEAVLKRFYRDEETGTITLISENPSYPPMVFTKDSKKNIYILGKAVAFQSDVK